MKCEGCRTANPAGTQFCGGCGKPVVGFAPAPVADNLRTPGRASDPGKASIIVGSLAGCDVVLLDPSISREHLQISLSATPGRFVIRDLNSSNGTFVAGRQIDQAEVWRHESIQLGLRPVPMVKLVAPLEAQGRGATSAGRTLSVGRDAEDADFELPYSMVSRRHMEARIDGGLLEVRDLGSANGTTVDGREVRTDGWAPVSSAATLMLGSFRVPSATMDQWLRLLRDDIVASPTTRAAVVEVPRDCELLLGRDPSCDVTIDMPQVSGQHALITSRDGRWIIKDLGSSNGVFRNGSQVRTSAVEPGDKLSLGSLGIRLVASEEPVKHQVVAVDISGRGVRLDAFGLEREVTLSNGRPLVILDQVELSIFPGELVALMGPSGAGKTTLLEILTGQRRPERGNVVFNGLPLHDNVELLREQIGYVPQEDVMHRDLTVFEVLYFAAVMKLPKDLGPAQVISQVDELITQMGLAHIRDSQIGGEAVRGISGGQRKRVNIALELITKPPMLFLDEPTSGLDSTSTMEVLNVLRDLADQGHTIVMTIHQPRAEAFALVDRLVLLAKGGKLAYFGPGHPEAATYVQARSKLVKAPGCNTADYVMDALDPTDQTFHRDPDEWKAEYIKSSEFNTYVSERRAAREKNTGAPIGGRARYEPLKHYSNLVRRYALRKWRDKMSLGIQVAQAPIIAVLLAWLFFDSAYELLPSLESNSYTPVGGVHATLFLLAAASFWFGCSNVARELVGDRPMFRRERMASLPVMPYLAAVLSVQVAIAALQTLIMATIAWPMVQLQPETFLAGWMLLLITATSGICIGLFVSAVARTEVMAISIVPLLLLPQLMLAGFIKLYRLMGDLEQLVSYLVPMRWAFEGLAWLELDGRSGKSIEVGGVPSVLLSAIDMEQIYGFPVRLDEQHVLLDFGMLFLFAAIALVLTWWRLSTTETSSS